MKVAIAGVTGETGSSVIDGLIAAGYDITTLVRATSLDKPNILRLKDRGVKIAPLDLDGPLDDIAAQLAGVHVFISCLLMKETVLADAAKKAGVKRFVPCWFAMPMPRGLVSLRDGKDGVLDYVQQLHLPYTAIDVGWWYQISMPRLPSGRLDENLFLYNVYIPGTGDVPSGLTDRRDIGKYVARIIADPRTLNKKVFAFTELLTQNEIYEMFERLSGEKIPRNHRTAEEVDAQITEARNDPSRMVDVFHFSYHKSMSIEGENTPEFARYLGYVVAKDLYPDLQGKSYEDFLKEILEVGLEPMYQSSGSKDFLLQYGTLAFKGAPKN